MRKIPPKLRAELATLPQVCARKDSECSGRITWEHALLYAGRQVQERFAIIPLCVYHHLGAGLNKRINIKIALNHANKEDLKRYPKQQWHLQA